MAASVENRHLVALKGFQGLPCKPGPTSHDSPVRGCSLPPSADITLPNNPNLNATARFDYSSSDEDDDDDDENDYSSAIKKANAELEPSVLDSRDEATADNWVVRNPSMVRLTGKHPFNAEPPLPRLMHTVSSPRSPPLRPQPRSVYNEWTVEVTGLVKNPCAHHAPLEPFPSREFPRHARLRRKPRKEPWSKIGCSGARDFHSVWRGVLALFLNVAGLWARKRAHSTCVSKGRKICPAAADPNMGRA
ncbi:UNVERIFIED_CONTAM: Nitrate reductase [NADH] [Sesamum angustifolium]|uniref:Nitrate reductase [NADH] n=1 Tax=Sesamum angustifolium TaxID=2727405 RepID=A0AAW2NLX5_9LAMI